MKESIQKYYPIYENFVFIIELQELLFFRRIVIHDFSAPVFQLFLNFVYTGQITTEVTLEVLSELIALADRY